MSQRRWTTRAGQRDNASLSPPGPGSTVNVSSGDGAGPGAAPGAANLARTFVSLYPVSGRGRSKSSPRPAQSAVAYDLAAVGSLAPVGRSKPDTVYFFGTCVVDLFFPEAGLSAVRLLSREGLRVVFPRGQTCCGQPPYNCGYDEPAREVARAQLRLFRQPWPVVVPSGSCAAMMKHHYPELFRGDPAEAEARDFASRVWELTQFLSDVLAVRLTDRGEATRVTWHSSCHALREMGVAEEPRRLLAQLGNVELVPLQRETECCGFGGTFALRQPEISAAMADDKADAARATGAATLLSGDAGCLLRIDRSLGEKDPIRVRHVADFLWERTR
jgi:L-lactate dehydrogenase complex protein LldE